MKNCFVLFTFSKISTIIVNVPSNTSHLLIFSIFLKIDLNVPTKSSLFPLIPSNDFNCDVAIFIDAAVVNPVITGNDIKSSKKPVIEIIILDKFSRKI